MMYGLQQLLDANEAEDEIALHCDSYASKETALKRACSAQPKDACHRSAHSRRQARHRPAGSAFISRPVE
jgi:hypothetical protein